MTTLNEFLEKALIKEERPKEEFAALWYSLEKKHKIMGRVKKMFFSKQAETAGQWMDDIIRKKGGVDALIKDLESIANYKKATFGKQPKIRILIGKLKEFEDKGLDLMDVWDDITMLLEKHSSIQSLMEGE